MKKSGTPKDYDERTIIGPFMVYKPMNEAETAKAAKIIAERKAQNNRKKHKNSLEKVNE